MSEQYLVNSVQVEGIEKMDRERILSQRRFGLQSFCFRLAHATLDGHRSMKPPKRKTCNGRTK